MTVSSEGRRLAAALGPVGLFHGGVWPLSAARAAEALSVIEAAGVGAFWAGEGERTKEAFTHAAVSLAHTRRLVFACGIANTWARDATAMAAGARVLGEAYPGRFVLGLGVSHLQNVAVRGGDYGEYVRPLARMRRYLDQMDAAEARLSFPAPAVPVPRVLAALRPRMLGLAAERTAGVFSFFVPVEHTAQARTTLGPEPFLAAEQAVVFADRDQARTIAHDHVMHRLERENYRNHLLALGFTESDLSGGGSDRLFDAIIAWGDVDTITARIRDHLTAGADHVVIDIVTPDNDLPIDHIRQLIPSLVATPHA